MVPNNGNANTNADLIRTLKFFETIDSGISQTRHRSANFTTTGQSTISIMKNCISKLKLNESFEVGDGRVLNYEKETFVVNAKKLVQVLYESLLTNPDFEHVLLSKELISGVDDYLSHIDVHQRLMSPYPGKIDVKIVNFLSFESPQFHPNQQQQQIGTLRKQTLIMKTSNLINSKTAFVNKTQFNQFTRIVPLSFDSSPKLNSNSRIQRDVRSSDFIYVSGPVQFNDMYPYARDSDTVGLVDRVRFKFPWLYNNNNDVGSHLQLESLLGMVVDVKVSFRPCFGDRTIGRIWISDHFPTSVKVINCCGFGFTEIDSVGGVVEYVRALVSERVGGKL
ncbi:unnamed protein product [Ambrosiozyma monospora]|uniref:Unnamed protein product n=1 Tax=Ambrosiozyma monospora TaxID=43982 RepID=A0A9W6Z6L7_AMBMO|nr:unnamed protein product [Ambrosiozyma monospora]